MSAVYGWSPPHAVVWPTTAGACSHVAPDSCPVCDGAAAEQRDLTPAQRLANLRRAGLDVLTASTTTHQETTT